MHAIIDFVFRTLTNPDRLIEFLSTVMTGWLGYALLFAIVFSETGLLVGFFLPGDSLLFTIGVVARAGPQKKSHNILNIKVAAHNRDAERY
jgi:membrane-associated protein